MKLADLKATDDHEILVIGINGRWGKGPDFKSAKQKVGRAKHYDGDHIKDAPKLIVKK